MIKSKFLSLLLATLFAFVFTGCESNIDHPIAGHTYSSYGGNSIGSISVYIHFASNGSFDIDYMEKLGLGMSITNTIISDGVSKAITLP